MVDLHLTNFSFEYFYAIFTDDASLLFPNRGAKKSNMTKNSIKGSFLKAGPPLDLSFWSFLTFLHHGIEKVERHLL